MITNAGEIGIIQDIPGHELPLNAFTDGQNVRFNDNYVEKSLGHSTVFTPSVAPYHVHPLKRTAVFYWIYCGLTKIYITEGTVHTDISNGTYSTLVSKGWTSDDFQGIPVFCNEIEVPQILYPVAPTNTLIDLPNWPTDVYTKVIKRFKSYLVALNVTESGTTYGNLIRTSSQTDAGTYPSSWDYTDNTNAATRRLLDSANGQILNGGELGDNFIIYCEGSTHEMRFIGGRFVFAYRTLFSESGMFAKKCFAKYIDNGIEKHCVLTNDDLIVHDGHTYVSIVDQRYKDTLFDELENSDNSERSFLVANYKTDEIWICYPTGSNAQCNKALIWNYRHNTFAFRDITASHIGFEVVDPTSTATWNSDTDTWNSDTTLWDTRLYDPSKRRMLMADATNTKLYKVDDTNQFSGVSFASYIQRDGLGVMKGGKVDTVNRKHIRTLYPKMSGSGTVTFYTGTQDAPGGSITWDSGTSFTIGTDYKVDVRNDGRLLAYKIYSLDDVSWRFYGMDIDFEPAGRS